MKVLAWVTESGWTACVDTVATLPDAEVTLLHVASEEPVQASAGALAGLLGRHRRGPEVEARLEDLAGEAAEALLRDAAARLGDPAVRQVAARGRPEDVVIEAARDADVLVVVRDTRDLGPRSISHATRFVVDHAPCRLLLAWPEGGPQGGPPPPPPHHPHEAPPPPPPHEPPPPPPQR
jgi:nucleotide-binding universal stress UspA family protein